MGLFKNFKDDSAQGGNGISSAGAVKKEDIIADAVKEEINVKSELSKLDGLLEQVKEESVMLDRTAEKEVNAKFKGESMEMDTLVKDTTEVLDETSVITASTVLTGDIKSAGSFNIQGTINGNITCNGKLVVTGVINGNSSASEFFADVAKVEGEIVSTGTVKIGAGSVIVGNIIAASAVIAGAVKGDIDVQGPVVIDTTAVIMGNIKSRSVQINNGAIIEGFCSQCYADVAVKDVFN